MSAAEGLGFRPAREGRDRDRRAVRPSGPPPVGFLPALEGLRGAAALWVVAYHCSVRTGGDPVGPWPVAPVVASGSLGVDVFFVLSGCVLCLGTVAGGTGPRGRAFLVRRAARLYPAAWLSMAVVLLAAPWIVVDPALVYRTVTPESVVANGLLLGGVGRLLPDYDGAIGFVGNPVLWSLTPEVLFSLLLVPLATALRRRPVLVALAALAAGVVLRTLEPDARVLSVLGPLLTAFPIGVLAAVAIATRPRRTMPSRLLLIVGAGLLLLIVVTRSADDLAALKHQVTAGPVLPIAVSLAAGLLIVGLADARASAVGRVLAGTPARALGRWSYGIYLFHFPIIGALVWAVGLPHDGSGRAFALALVTALPLSIAAGAWSHRFVEYPVQRLVRRTVRP